MKVKHILKCYAKYIDKIFRYRELLKTDNITLKQVISYNEKSNSRAYEILSELEKKENIKSMIADNISRMIDVCNRIECSVDMLEEKQKKVIKFRYFEKMTWEEIAEVMEISTQYVYRLHGRALEELEVHFISQKLLKV